MRQVILQEFVTLDGLAAGPNGNVEFVPEYTNGDPSVDEYQLRFTDTIDTILLGRVTYQMFADYWPKTTNDDDPASDVLNQTPKLVFSKTLDRAPWGEWPEAKVVKADAAEAVARLKAQPGKDMVLWGSISLARSLMQAGLIDQYKLVVCPVVLGGGTPLFSAGAAGLVMKLLDTQRFDRGAVVLTYAPAKG
jgi:dihydrofolate reductase